jgi:hypothetical protein
MEQATSGQIGQPAACMIENKWNLRANEKPRNYGPSIFNLWFEVMLVESAIVSPTFFVDNFVKKWVAKSRQTIASVLRYRLITNEAVKNTLKSWACKMQWCVQRLLPSCGPDASCVGIRLFHWRPKIDV